MSQAKIQSIIDRGGKIAATILGSQCQQYRPASASSVIVPVNLLGTIPVYMDAKADAKARQPNLPGHPIWYITADTSNMRVGDYLVAPERTIYVLSMQPLLPRTAVECNRTIKMLYRPGKNQQPGTAYYGSGDQTTNKGATLASGWPISLLLGQKGEADKSGAIGSPRQPWCQIMMPLIPGVVIATADVLLDDLGRKWAVSGVEQTETMRITAALESA